MSSVWLSGQCITDFHPNWHMNEPQIKNRLKARRTEIGWSQQELAERAEVSRQTIAAVESGRNTPSTGLGLRLARALTCEVEDLFSLTPESVLSTYIATCAPVGPSAGDVVNGSTVGSRVAMALIGNDWIAHPLGADSSISADGIVVSASEDGSATVQPLATPGRLARNILLAGCAPLLGGLSQRMAHRFTDARVSWIRAGSRAALQFLADGVVHVAGAHLASDDPKAHIRATREALANKGRPARKHFAGDLLLVNLTRWRQGLIVPAGNPIGFQGGKELLQPGVKFARREKGSSAWELTKRVLASAGASSEIPEGPLASSHEDVSRMVKWGVADVGVAVEGVALAHGLDFVPLAKERFDLVVPAVFAAKPPVSRLLATLDDPVFRMEVDALPGYDSSLTGQAIRVESG